MYTVLSKRLQALNQFVSREIEIFVNVFQSGRSDGFHSYQRAFNSCRFHRIQKFGVLGGLHGDLGEENHVVGEPRQARHQLEPLVADSRQLIYTRCIVLLCRKLEICQRDRIEIVVRQRHKTKSQPA